MINLKNIIRIILISICASLPCALNVAAQSRESDIRALEPNQTFEQEMTGAETHRYNFDLKAGEFFQVRVQQKGVDVLLRLLDSGGSVLATMDSPSEKQGPETLSFIAEQDGNYKLQISGFDEKAEKGFYFIERKISRKAADKDKKRMEVEKLFVDGMALRDTAGNSDKALKKLEEALKGWRKLDDEYLAALTTKQIEQLRQVLPSNQLKKTIEDYSYLTNELWILSGDAKTNFEKVKGLTKCDEAIKVFQERNLKSELAETFHVCGIINKKIGNQVATLKLKRWNTARDYFTKAISLSKEINDKKREFSASVWLGDLSDDKHKYQEAIEHYNNAFLLAGELKNREFEAHSLKRLADLYFATGNSGGAVKLFKSAIEIYRGRGEFDSAGISTHFLAWIYRENGDYENALKYFREALVLFKNLTGQDEQVIMMLRQIGDTYRRVGDAPKALASLQEALTLAEKIKSPYSHGDVLSEISNVYQGSGDYSKAMDALQKSLTIKKTLNDWSRIGGAELKIARLYSTLGDNQSANEYYISTLFSGMKAKDLSLIDSATRAIAEILWQAGKTQEAIDLSEEHLKYLRKENVIRLESNILEYLADLYGVTGNYSKQTEYLQQALALSVKQENKNDEIDARIRLAVTDLRSGNREQAKQQLEKSLSLSKEVGDPAGEAYVLETIGSFHIFAGDNQKASEYYKEALQFRRSTGNRRGEANDLNVLMALSMKTKNPRLAVFYGKSAVNLLQEIRTATQELDIVTQKSLLTEIQDVYRGLTHILISQNRLAEAQQILNLLKDQQFFDFSKNKEKKANKIFLTPREAEYLSFYNKDGELLANNNRLLAENKRLTEKNKSSDEISSLELQTQKVIANFQKTLEQAETDFNKPSAEKDKMGEIPDLKEIQAVLQDFSKSNGQKGVAIYQVVGEENFSALVITPDSIEKVEVPFKGEELNEKASQLWALLKSDRYDTTVLSKEIYDVVFAPLEAKLPQDTRAIMWSLDGNLRYLPMAALFDGKQFLVERYTHSVFTRADSERMTRKVSDTWTGTGFGSSDAATVEVLGSDISFDALDGVKAELDDIFKNGDKGILSGETFSNKEFSKTNFIGAMKKQRPLVHIASHFSFRPGDEARSFLLMGDKTAFTLEEMKREENLFQGVELLTLSACNTAAQEPGANGREIDGFAELAQRLKAGAVMATLWAVADESTATFMSNFYKLKADKPTSTKSENIQKVQIGMLKGDINATNKWLKQRGSKEVKTKDDKNKAPLYKFDEKKPFAHPYYWSPFVLYGNWK